MDLIRENFPQLNEHTINKLFELAMLFFYWNTKINIISRADIMNVVEHHILHSLSILKFMDFYRGLTIVDVGTGGGLPALPLSLLKPDNKFILIDGTGKKIKVVKEIVATLKLDNVIAIHGRIENKKEVKGHYFVGRAVAPIPKLVKWIKNRFLEVEIPGGIPVWREGQNQENPPYAPPSLIYLKGNDIQHDIIFFQKKSIPYLVFNIYEKIKHPYFKEKIILMAQPPF